MKTLKVLFPALLVCLIGLKASYAQVWGYPWADVDTSGDTTWHTFPPSDTTYIHTDIAIKFRPHTLDYSQLCYDCDTITNGAKHGMTSTVDTSFEKCKETLMTQIFDLSVVLDTNVRNILAAHGVSYLMRMTAANPCTDTLSIARSGDSSVSGDTVPMDDFDWMIAYFNNDTSAVSTLEALWALDSNGLDSTHFSATGVDMAELDQKLSTGYVIPGDPWWANQHDMAAIGMTSLGAGSPGVWDYEVGDKGTAVAVVDNGVDYWRCDLGAGITPNKVIGGWNYGSYIDPCTSVHYGPSVAGIFHNAGHGTQVASIIGAYTNNFGCGVTGGTGNGMAGIGGGWGTLGGAPNLGPGIQILGYNCGIGGEYLSSVWLASAIFEAVAQSVHGKYGYGVTAVNNSWGGGGYNVGIRSGIYQAKNNFADFMAAKGNRGISSTNFPSDYDPQTMVIAVGAAALNAPSPPVWHPHPRDWYSQWNKHVDIIAPGGAAGAYFGHPADHFVYALQFDASDCTTGPSANPDVGGWFDGTSAATPHVSGVDAIARDYLLKLSYHYQDAVVRGDPEGILKASAYDVTGNDPYITGAPAYLSGYDLYTGWGFLQADRLFQMFDPTMYKYQLAHFEIPCGKISYGAWSTTKKPVTFYRAAYGTGYSGKYMAYIREVKGVGTYAGLHANLTKPVYVWGNTNAQGQRGYAQPDQANACWFDPWCEVTDGDGDGNGYVANMKHNTSTTVNLHTYQYDLYTTGGSHMGHVPPDATCSNPNAWQVGMGFTVLYVGLAGYGGKITDSSRTTAKAVSFSVIPSIASDHVEITIAPSIAPSAFQVIDAIGRIVWQASAPLSGNFQISTSELPAGFYVCRLITANSSVDVKIIVEH